MERIKKEEKMKKILVLTDFSANATCAAQAGLTLSGLLHTDILLYNTYINYETMASYGGGGWIVGEITERQKKSKLGLELLVEGLESLVAQSSPGEKKPVINFQSNDCNLQMGVADLLKEHQVELIIMGARSHSHDDTLYGNDTSSIIDHCNRPVLIIPEGTDLQQIKKVIFATDFNDADLDALHYVIKLSKLLHYKIDVIHVAKAGFRRSEENTNAGAFKEQLLKLNYQGLTYHEISGKDAAGRIERLFAQTGPVLIAILHHQRSFFGRLFSSSETKKILKKQTIPLLVFPSKMVSRSAS